MEKTDMCSYLYRRGSVYCTRLVVPPRLRPIVGKSDLGRSLRTKELAEAKRLLPEWLAEAQATIAAAEAELARRVAPAVATGEAQAPTEWELENDQFWRQVDIEDETKDEAAAEFEARLSEAQRRIRELDVGAAVNPGAVASSSRRKIGQASAVDFDVAVLASEETSEQSGSAAKASLGLISVVSARTAAELDSRSSGGQRNETTSRIKFSVQLAQPADLHEYHYDQVAAPGTGKQRRSLETAL